VVEVLAYAFLVMSAVGFVASLVSHVCSLLGVDGPLGDRTMLLHMGIFVVWFPAILAARRVGRDAPQKDQWKAALRGCPEWMRYALYGLFGYTFLNFALFLFRAHGRGSSGPGGSASPSVVRGFSGHWMLFYFAAFAMLYSYLHLEDTGPRRCSGGHEVGPLAKFCEQCGAPVVVSAPATSPR
jgi:hypothetical protein